MSENDLPSGFQPAFEFLRERAVDAHLAGDGLRVLQVCWVAMEHLRSSRSGNVAQHVPFDLVRWCFGLALNWALSGIELRIISDEIRKFPPDGNSKYDRDLLLFIARHLQDPINRHESEQLMDFPAEWLGMRCSAVEDIAILNFAIELVWTRDPFGDSWQKLAQSWAAPAPSGSQLAMSLPQTADRLRYQTYLTHARWPEGDQPSNPKSSYHPMAEGFEHLLNCEWEKLDHLIKSLVPRVRVDDSSYPALFHLIHASRMERHMHLSESERGNVDDEVISLKRYRASTSRQPAQVYESHRQQLFLDSSLRLSRAESEGTGDRLSCLRLSMLEELSALRNWDMIAWRDSIRHQVDANLDVARFKEIDFAKLAIVNSVRALSVPDEKKESRFRDAVELMDVASQEDREEIVGELLRTRPLEWPVVFRTFVHLSDAIPESMLPEVAKWSVQLETSPRRLVFLRHTWLSFWNDIIGYSENTTSLVDGLTPALLRACKLPITWHDKQVESLLRKVLIHARLPLAQEIFESLSALPPLDSAFESSRWKILFNASVRRPELREVCIRWLGEHANDDPVKQHHLKRMEQDASGGPMDDPELRQQLIHAAEGLAQHTQRSEKSPFEIISGINSGAFRFVTWPKEDIAFTYELVKAIDSNLGTPTEKLEALQVLAAVLDLVPTETADHLVECGLRWLRNSIPFYDHASEYAGPFSSLRFEGVGPENLERGIWFFGYALLQHKPEAIRAALMDRVIRLGLRCHSESLDVVWAIMVRLALTASDEEEAMAMALVGMSEALVNSVDRNSTPMLLGTLNSFLEPDSIGEASVVQSASTNPGRMLISFWGTRLIELADSSFVKVRVEVARTLATWSKLSAKFPEFPFPTEMKNAFDKLHEDARMRVRWACRNPDDAE